MSASDSLRAGKRLIPLLRVVPTAQFLDNIFLDSFLPPNISVDSIYDKLRRDEAFTHTGEDDTVCWEGWPEGLAKCEERALYRSCVEAGNAITSVIPSGYGITGRWFDRHGIAPGSADKKAIRPDCLLVSKSVYDQLKALETEIQALVEEIQTRSITESVKEKTPALQTLEKKLNIWWLHVHVVLEMKAGLESTKDLTAIARYSSAALQQALIYMRRMLEEQLDRRFVIGLVICSTQLTLLLMDRFAILITETPIDINKDPKAFIRVIAGLRCMSPDRLGWDTTMKLYQPIPNAPVGHIFEVPSYEAVASFERKTRYHLHWMIEIVMKDRKEKYVTIRTLSALRSAETCGRSTLMFEVVKLADLSKPDAETRALKRYWRPFAAEPVVELVPPQASETSANELVDHIHAQILMPVGTPIKLFCDLLEFGRRFHGCVIDPRHAHNNLIIHRDVSIRNLLIYPHIHDGGKTFGRFKDFDHAKKALKFISFPSSRAPARQHDFFKAGIIMEGCQITDDAVVEALRFVDSEALTYTEAVIKSRFGSQKGLTLTTTNLGWDHGEETRWPDFSDRKAREEERSGTLPFISLEVLQQGTLKIQFKATDKHGFSHNSVHDMESFLWVLIYLCLTRSGRGIDMLREVLNPSHENYAPSGELAKAILIYFDAEELKLGLAKRQLFTNPHDVFETAIIRLFHPCFEPLKPLVRQWWTTLKLAYVYHGNEYYHIHAHILRLLENTLSVFQTRTDLGQEAATTRELKRRKSHRECLQVMAMLDPAMDTITPPMFLVAPQTTPEYHQVISSSDSIIPPDSPTRRPAIKKRRVA